MRLAGARAVVIGLGASGAAAAKVLSEEGASVRISEARALEELDTTDISSLDVELLAGGHEVSHLDRATLVVVSPGVPQDAEIIRWAQERAIPIWSELELGAQLADVPYIAVTGTNGKSTTTEMIAACLQAAGRDAVACGNIGYPFSLAAREGHQALVVEASSFQLTFQQTLRPKVSVLLNLAPDHIDWHGSLEAYARSKARVFANQGSGDTHVGNADDPAAATLSREARCKILWFRLGEPVGGDVGYRSDQLVAHLETDDVALGEPTSGHAGFRADAAAAAAASLAFGLDAASVTAGIAHIHPLSHRGEVVATIGTIRFIDDSKATNPHAALAALEGLNSAVLIAGGRSKGVDLSPLAEAAPRLDGVVAIGEAASQIEDLFSGIVPVSRAESIEQAAAMALPMASPGGAVVLAPGCASQDQFKDYKERGDRFTRAARGLAAAHGGTEGP